MSIPAIFVMSKRTKIKDEQWAFIEPIIQASEPPKKAGRPTHSFRDIFEGIVWVLANDFKEGASLIYRNAL